jgi:hypothetical protein
MRHELFGFKEHSLRQVVSGNRLTYSSSLCACSEITSIRAAQIDRKDDHRNDMT